MSNLEKTIAKAFLEMAEGLETGSFGPRPRIALTGMGSEHGEENAMAAAVAAARRGGDVRYIGALEGEGVTTVRVDNEDEGHKRMEQMVESGEVDGAVTMHFPFPIGVSTVGRVVTPAKGKEMFIATSTGTASADRIEGMIKNAVYGIITAKASGVKDPTVGILNVDGARQTEMALNQLQKNGYLPLGPVRPGRRRRGAPGQRRAPGYPRRAGLRQPHRQRAGEDALRLHHRRQLRVRRLRLRPRHRPRL